jgi:peptide/nickel transport system substrate-binding protein
MNSQPRTHLTRRDFLRVASILGGSALLAACQQAPAPAAKPTEATKPAAAAAAQPTTAPAAAAPAKPAEAAKPADAAKPAAPAAAAQPTTAPAAASAPAGQAGGTLNYAESADFNDFNPWSFTAVNFGAYNQIYSRLFWKDGSGKVNADIATAWEMAQDNLSFTVKLRQDVKWHDGKPLTAQDFVDMYGYTKDETLSKYLGVSKVKGIMTPVKDVKATDPYTLVFSFEKPTPYITDILDYFFAIRITDKADPQFLKATPIGTGPFNLAKWTPNQFAQMDKNADFYLKGQPLLDQFMFKRFSQAETLAPNLKSGAVDDVLLTSLSDVGPLQSDGSYNVEANENAGSIYDLIVNVRKPPLDKREVRQALSYSLNREGMAKSAFFGVSRPITSPFYSQSSLAYREDLLMAHKFDLDKAKSLLEAAGVTNLELRTATQPAMPQYKLYLLIWQSDLAKIGVKLTVDEVENAKFLEMAATPDLQGLDFAPHLTGRTTRDPAIFFSTQGPFRASDFNLFGYRNAEFEKLVADGAVEPDAAKRKSIYQQLNQMIVDEMFTIPIATNPRIWAASKKLQGVQIDLNANLYLAQASLAR